MVEDKHGEVRPSFREKRPIFDDLATELASGALSRRTALKLVGVAILGGLGLTALFPDEAEAKKICPEDEPAKCCGKPLGVSCKKRRTCKCPPNCKCIDKGGFRGCSCEGTEG